jgi:hypothetical protein
MMIRGENIPLCPLSYVCWANIQLSICLTLDYLTETLQKELQFENIQQSFVSVDLAMGFGV